ncbi:hypothetical protein [Actinomyces oris]|uniref:DUF4352 domain-containing protein n=1 Tax=Actinomyces oris TaxID=544580 RepID=A0A1Q8VV59_9ACTO|nr:hypothetical protein [Actinomyces oris]OLL15867.1 hypothetical protein BKH32_01260 [Actinomyces oris]OLO52017.1 hypothetical protein BKH30_07540 [Actinomyces oris]
MALRFNPPPNWPAPPEGFEPPAGWQPDPAWGPAPEGWQIWVDDSAASGASAASAAGAATEADPAWAPTQAVSTAPTAPLSTSSPVADPTGMSASAPSGDYAGPPASVGASPYAANMDYAQSPTPYQPQGAAGGMQPPTGGWQPNAAVPAGPGNGSKPLTQQWWFWTGIAAVVVVALVIGGIFMFKGDSSDSDNKADSTSSSEPDNPKKPKPSKNVDDPDPTDNPDPKKPTKTSNPNNNSHGSSEKDPIDPKAGAVTLNAGKYDDDPNASVDVTFGDVEWNANESIKAVTSQYSYKEPPAGKVYIRVPVEITYHGQGQFDKYDLKVGFTHEGNTAESELIIGGQSLFNRQSMPRDGGKAKGDFVFLVDESAANEKKGAFAVSAFSQVDNKNEVYVAAK